MKIQLLILIPILLCAPAALAQEAYGPLAPPENMPAYGPPPEQKISPYSSTVYGLVGLNIIPSARMDAPGTIKMGVAALDPYTHGFLGFQIAAPLYIGLRQSAEVSGITDSAEHLYPGADVKLRLLKETRARPEISVGLQSALGHKRMAAEYIAASKRWRHFDFTAGMGWGRMGTAAHMNNPLKSLNDHFGKRRATDGEMPNEPGNWFTGEDVGLFGGVEYFTPLNGLSLKFDIGADRYAAEKTASGFSAPAPWSAGINYAPRPWISLGLAAQGHDKIMGRLTLQTMLADIKNRGDYKKRTIPLRAFRTGLNLPAQMEISAQKDGVLIANATQDGPYTASADLTFKGDRSAPAQIGQAAIHMANHAGPAIEALTIRPAIMGLQGPSVRLMRADLERAVTFHNGSPEEIWKNAELDPDAPLTLKTRARHAELGLDQDETSLILEQHMSLSEEDSGVLTRTALIMGYRGARLMGLLDHGYGLRINAHDNLNRLTDIRPRSLLPVRSDVDLFARRTVSLDHTYAAYTHSFKPTLHLALLGGYLEEMYAGAGGEILWRPFASRFALGAESWLALKRDPLSGLNLGLNGDHVLTAHANLWYDLPRYDLTLHAKAGRYLAEDIGATLGLMKKFKNGISLEAFATVTDNADYDLLGGTTHADHGIRLSIPLGGYKYVPDNTRIKFRAEPFGRDMGQSLQSPLSLYSLTEKFSYDHLARHWDEIAE